MFKMKEKPILITPTHESTQSLLIFPFSENHRGAFAPCGTAPEQTIYIYIFPKKKNKNNFPEQSGTNYQGGYHLFKPVSTGQL